ncbi:MAG: hypothetical protein M3041_12060 [Acidobacteriota bacterium]|nr:hypothetical protein [Acidobacteriota bacterium]
MKKLIAVSLFLLLAVTGAFAHAGHIHTYMGSVTKLHGDNAFMMKTAAGKDITIQTSTKTRWLHSDNHAAKKSELALGQRVVVKMMADGKTADTVKMSAPPKK